MWTFRKALAHALMLALVGAAVLLAARRFEPGASAAGGENYLEECQRDGCDGEEVRELYESYQEECLSESCNQEEIFELAGTHASAAPMLEDFQRRGWTVNRDDLLRINCTHVKTDTFCAVLVTLCRDNYHCPGGLQQSSWYSCGSCFLGLG